MSVLKKCLFKKFSLGNVLFETTSKKLKKTHKIYRVMIRVKL